MITNKEERFQWLLLDWFSRNHRPLPWKGERDPYIIWLSEIILQQTTVEQGTAYFEKFKKTYPSVFDLANAPDDAVMKLWEGLGYYARARNLLAAARHIVFELNGSFPTTYIDILNLKGVGPYTAAAIASFAFNEPRAVVDGNVYRVLSRVFGIETPIDAPHARTLFTDLAMILLDKNRPADFNQAIMDFGATCCTPAKPQCVGCVMQADCIAFQEKKVHVLPAKSKKMVKKERFFNYLIFNNGANTYIRKRIEKDIWQDLYEFPLVETRELGTEDNLNISNLHYTIIKKSQPFKQQLTHQTIIGIFWEIEVKDGQLLKEAGFLHVDRGNLSAYAFPKLIDSYLKEKVLTLF